jgi:Protein of unknown function (DUF4240)
MIDEDQFWLIIEAAWPATEQVAMFRQLAFAGELEASDDLYRVQKQMLANLTDALNRLDATDLLAFDRILERRLYDLDREDIHAYTDGSDDGFLYCRGFIVSIGKAYYDLVSSEPSHALIDLELEEICYLPYGLYEERFGPVPTSGISRETGSKRDGWSS